MVKLDDLKRLTPEERIKKLKELEQEKKDEIEQAHKMISESEKQIDREAEIKREIPIPQVTAVSIDSLFSKEEKQLFRSKRFADEEEQLTESAEAHLEQTVQKEQAMRHGEDHSQYEIKKIEKETQQLYSAAKDTYAQAKNELRYDGRMSEDTAGRMGNLYREAQEKERSLQESQHNISAAMEEELNISKGLIHKLVDWYKR